ncbi:hypothetical protein Csa_014660 [Cucumis sativus]|uniref:Uncharacterized protein n=1 Tax=Cucumis sativus TaxID=3659 RepID=A0A0A0KXQ3_CUCSA|nr:hypothetical protein Csa_014660 [Cucumis sativus]
MPVYDDINERPTFNGSGGTKGIWQFLARNHLMKWGKKVGQMAKTTARLSYWIIGTVIDILCRFSHHYDILWSV